MREFDLENAALSEDIISAAPPVSLFTASQHEGADLVLCAVANTFIRPSLLLKNKGKAHLSEYRSVSLADVQLQNNQHTKRSQHRPGTRHPDVMNEQFIALEPSGVSLGPLNLF